MQHIGNGFHTKLGTHTPAHALIAPSNKPQANFLDPSRFIKPLPACFPTRSTQISGDFSIYRYTSHKSAFQRTPFVGQFTSAAIALTSKTIAPRPAAIAPTSTAIAPVVKALAPRTEAIAPGAEA
jgi:hypothetical protein